MGTGPADLRRFDRDRAPAGILAHQMVDPIGKGRQRDGQYQDEQDQSQSLMLFRQYDLLHFL